MLETNAHFPTDANLLCDAQRKCADLLVPMAGRAGLEGWRKSREWRRKLKGQMIAITRLTSGGGSRKEERKRAAALAYPQRSAKFDFSGRVGRVAPPRAASRKTKDGARGATQHKAAHS